VRFLASVCLAVAMLPPIASKGAGGNDGSGRPWIATAGILLNGAQSGSGVYLWSGLIVTAAHLTALNASMGARIAGVVLPAKLLKQGSAEDVDLSLLLINEEKIPATVQLPRMHLCEAPPWPGDPVIVVDAGHATQSHIVAPQVLPFTMRNKFPTLIADVTTTGNSGSGVFDPRHHCLLGIMSQKIVSHTAEGDKDIAKYFVPAAAIRQFVPADFKPHQ
jgi:hypothetical protein